MVTSCNPTAGTVLARCTNTATIGCATRSHDASLFCSNALVSTPLLPSERKNCNLPGVIVDLPTITEKDTEDLLQWGVPNAVDFIAASFVRKGSDVSAIRRVMGKGGENIKIISKARTAAVKHSPLKMHISDLHPSLCGFRLRTRRGW